MMWQFIQYMTYHVMIFFWGWKLSVLLLFCFCYRAYIHQYTKFGISEEDFLESFTLTEQIISSYSQLGCNV